MSNLSPAVILYDANGVAMAVEDGVAIPASTQGVILAGKDGSTSRFVAVDASGRPYVVGASSEGAVVAGNPVLLGGRDPSGNALAATVVLDTNDSKRRVAVEGKVQISAAIPPPAATAITVAADTPLVVGPIPLFLSVDYTITNLKTFFIQQIVVGAEGDPSEKGSKVEVIYVDSLSVEHVVERIYVSGFSQFAIYPDTSKARDGTLMTGDGSTTKLRIVRSRQSTSGQEIDAVVRGYEL